MYNSKLHFHFTGIGGSGMSGLAEILLNLGFTVSGSDLKYSTTCERLARRGAKIFTGHAAAHVPAAASLLVYSSAVNQSNPELVEARARELPVIPRAEVLAELVRMKYGVAVAGSHGKTTTTSMIASVLEAGALDPTVIIGGQVKALGSGGKLGRSDYLVAETDESDRSFLLLKPTIAVVTNIDNEHLTAYSSIQDLEQSFNAFVNSVPFFGLAILCIDDARTRDLCDRYKKRKITYGLSPDAYIRAVDLQFDKSITSFELWRGDSSLGRITIPMPGKHLACNSLAAIAVGLEFGIPLETIRKALANFEGVERRIEIVGHARGVTVISDYGHHPTEIRATLSAVRAGWAAEIKTLHVIFQPHRYSRTRDCFVDFLDSFSAADNLIMSEIYAASEEPIEGISGKVLCSAVNHARKYYVDTLDEGLCALLPELQPGDFVVCLGAGSIGGLALKLLEVLEADIEPKNLAVSA